MRVSKRAIKPPASNRSSKRSSQRSSKQASKQERHHQTTGSRGGGEGAHTQLRGSPQRFVLRCFALLARFGGLKGRRSGSLASQSPQRKPPGRPRPLLLRLTRSGRDQKVISHLPSTYRASHAFRCPSQILSLVPLLRTGRHRARLRVNCRTRILPRPRRAPSISRRSLTYTVRSEVPSCYFNRRLRPRFEPSPLIRNPRTTRSLSVSIPSAEDLLLKPPANCQ